MWEDVFLVDLQDATTAYAVLGVSLLASQEEIKQRFRRLALQCHPDKSGSSSGAAEQFHAIREAFQTLSDPVRRFNYDKTLVAQLDMQEYLARFSELVLTVQGLQLPPLRPNLHRYRRQRQQQQRQQAPHRCHPQGHAAARQAHAPLRPPMLTLA